MTDLTPAHLSEHHRTTLEQIERHPTSHNIEWHDVLALLDEAGAVREEHDGKYIVKLGEERLVISRPRHKDIDEQLVVDLRHLFTAAGYLPTSRA
ncbi:hypothetical protein [Leifsonia soli]|uniref:Type II toxin-antitoxin system HicA family toxin n=1 Tax=Leifsonia soli TaxID=582665 RepID=A0A852T1N7_9MICO|nr:hypothetical protein [Leifsonia soli]NYD75359.1 hypothetical protein [Leifsonia soli]